MLRSTQMILVQSGLAAVLLAAPSDPPVPAGGFGVNLLASCAIHTYPDGYQTYYDLRVPDATAPATGWPLVLIVHGGGGDKSVYAGQAEGFAKLGYASLTYDVRGQGTSMATLNDPAIHGATRDGLREIFDMFEILEAVEAAHPAEIDFSRIGVTGFSQGGAHTWNAVVHSGLAPPPNPWGRTAAFPTILAGVAQGCPGPRNGNPQLQTAFGVGFVEGIFSPGGIHFEPGSRATMENIVLTEDFAAWQTLTTLPGIDLDVLIPQTQVPLYLYQSYDDPKIQPTGSMSAWEALTSTKRMQLGTGHHGCPANQRDTQLFFKNRRLWFNRFLKGELNDVENGPTVVAATTPEDVSTYNALTSNWDFRRLASTDEGVQIQRMHLAPGGLQTAAPAAPSLQTVTHNLPAFVDMAWWTANVPDHAQVTATIPVSTVFWDSGPLNEDRHLFGRAAVRMQLQSAQTDYQVNVVLLDVDPSGATRVVTKADLASRTNTPGVTTAVDLDLDFQSYVFRTGHTIRLQFENLARTVGAFAGGQRMDRVPVFTNFALDVGSAPGAESWIDLPMLPFGDPVLSMYPFEQQVNATSDQRFTIHTDSDRAGHTYVLALTSSGTTPGVNVGPVNVPLNPDGFTSYGLANVNLPPFVDTLGVLDARGRAEPLIILPASVPAALIGVEMHFVGAVISPLGDLAVTEPEGVVFQ